MTPNIRSRSIFCLSIGTVLETVGVKIGSLFFFATAIVAFLVGLWLYVMEASFLLGKCNAFPSNRKASKSLNLLRQWEYCSQRDLFFPITPIYETILSVLDKNVFYSSRIVGNSCDYLVFRVSDPRAFGI